ASAVQLGAFVVLVRAVFPGRVREQTLALLVFLLVPYDHSIHHYRDMPVILASAAVFLLSAHFVGEISRARGVSTKAVPFTSPVLNTIVIFGIVLLGVWSRAEFLTFVAVLVLLAFILERRRALRLGLTYAAAAVLISAGLLVVYKIEDV